MSKWMTTAPLNAVNTNIDYTQLCDGLTEKIFYKELLIISK